MSVGRTNPASTPEGQIDALDRRVRRLEAKVFCTEKGRALADAAGIDLADVAGTGDMGKITTDDVRAALPEDFEEESEDD